MHIPLKKMILPDQVTSQSTPLFVFDHAGYVYDVLLFAFDKSGAAIGVRRRGDNFCARISIESLADFHARSKVARETEILGGVA